MKTHTEHEMGHLVYVISQADVHSFFLHCKNQRMGQYLNVNKCNVFKGFRKFGHIETGDNKNINRNVCKTGCINQFLGTRIEFTVTCKNISNVYL